MKLSKIRKRDIVVLVVFIIFCWFILDIYRSGLMASADNQIRYCVNYIVEYMNKNNGELPSEPIKAPYQQNIYNVFRDFKPENTELIDGKLFDKNTNKQILILNGPTLPFIKKWQQKAYEEASLKIYVEMLKSKLKGTQIM